jgi:catalase (peroxidase I)
MNTTWKATSEDQNIFEGRDRKTGDWGENGYGWVHYGTNNIGRKAAWVLAKPR